MKASEYAIIVIDGSKLPNADKLRCAAEVAHLVMKEAADKIKNHMALQSQLAIWRDGLSKWKGIVSRVLEDDPKHPIFINMYGAVMAIQNPELFRLLVANNVFIGYKLSVREQTVISEEGLRKILE